MQMPIDARFLSAVVLMAVVAYSCRVFGLLLGTYFGDNANVRRVLDVLPACAIAAVIGPQIVSMTLIQMMALSTSAGVYILSSRFLLALVLGTTVLLGAGALTTH